MILNKGRKLWEFYERKKLKENIADGEEYFSKEEKEILEIKERKVLIEKRSFICFGILILGILYLDNLYWGLYWYDEKIDITRNIVEMILNLTLVISLIQIIIGNIKIIKLIKKSRKKQLLIGSDILRCLKVIIIYLYLMGIGYFLTNGGLSTRAVYLVEPLGIIENAYQIENYEIWYIVASILLIIYLSIKNIYYFMIEKTILATIKNFLKALNRGGIKEVEKSIKFEGNNGMFIGKEYAIFFKVLDSLIVKSKELEKDKICALKNRTEIITNASHDIKTPLTSIKNYIYILENSELTKKEKEEYVNILKVKIKNLSRLIENLKLIAKEKSNYEIENLIIEEIKIIDLIDIILEEYSVEFLEKEIKINKILNENIRNIKIECNKELNKTIFRNLFSNIQKYALENTTIDLEIKKENGCLIIEIRNISKKKINISAEEIVKRFKRGDESRHTEGHGLGLDIVKKLVQSQKGIFSININEDKFESKIKYLI